MDDWIMRKGPHERASDQPLVGWAMVLLVSLVYFASSVSVRMDVPIRYGEFWFDCELMARLFFVLHHYFVIIEACPDIHGN